MAAGIAFRCTNWHTSKAIIDDTVATKLFGKGSMYFKCEQYEGIRRIQGSFMPPEEIMDKLDTMDFVQSSVGKEYEEVRFQISAPQKNVLSGSFPTICDPQTAVDSDEQFLIKIGKRLLLDKKEKISNKWLKDEFEMGYDRANRFLQLLENDGVISAQKKGTKLPRSINPDKLREFLDCHGYTDDVIEKEPNQALNTSDAHVQMEPMQE